MGPTERDLVWFHLVVLAVGTVVVLAGPATLGVRLTAVVLAYDVAMLALARWRDDPQLLRLWCFAAVLSLFQVIPDAFLVEGLGTLAFPPDGIPDIGPVTGYMAGLWTIPIVVVVGAGVAVEERRGRTAGALAAGAAGLIVFGAAEAILPLLPIWVARNVARIGEVAVYIVPAEVLLSVAAYDAYLSIRDRRWLAYPGVALLISLLYTGAAAASWLLVERVLRG